MSRPLKATSRLVALVAVLGLVVAACGDDNKKTDTSSKSNSGGSGGVSCDSGTAIAFFGALTGDNANLGVNIEHGAQLAVSQWNAANSGCKISLKGLDSQGSADQAPQLATQAISDKNIVAIVGPAVSAEAPR